MTNFVSLVGKVLYIYEDMFVIDLNGEHHLPINWEPHLKDIVTNKLKVGDTIGVAAYLVEGLKVIANRIVFLN
jgi:hypothetical protein